MVKMGRPTSNPRTEKISVRLTPEEKKLLLEYSKQNNLSLTQAISVAILLLKGQKK